ncbi:MAG: hypothetical protein ACI3XP_01970 [Eubacteriales bacterium]
MSRHREFPAALAEEAYRQARLRRLAGEPFSVDRLGMYAALLHGRFSCPVCILYLFDRRRNLLAERMLYSGRRLGAEQFCPQLPGLMQRSGAFSLALSVTASDVRSCTPEDIWELSRAALYCEAQRIPVLEMLLVFSGEYYPLYRRSGAVQQ